MTAPPLIPSVPRLYDPENENAFRTAVDRWAREVGANIPEVNPATVGPARTDSGFSVFNVFDYGAKGRVVSDDLAAFQLTADTAGDAGGGIVFAPPNDYNIAGPIDLPDNVWLAGAGYGTRIYQRSNAAVIRSAGSIATALSLTANALIGATSVTMSAPNAATLSTGDYLLLQSSEAVPSSTTSQTYGELVRVSGVVVGVVSLYGPIQRGYTTANSAAVRKLTMVSGVGVSNLRIVNPTPGTLTSGLVLARYCLEPTFQRLWFQGGDEAAIQIEGTMGGLVDGVWARDLTDDEANGRFGYGVVCVGACMGTRINNVHTERGRHAFTTSGNGGAGIPYGVVVSNSTAFEPTHAGFDTHQEGEGVTFDNCAVIGAKTNGSYHSRSPRTQFNTCRAISSDGDAFWIESTGTGTILSSCVVRNTYRVGGSLGRGVKVEAASCVIDNLTAQGCAAQAVLVQGADILIAGGRYENNLVDAATTGDILLDTGSDGATIISPIIGDCVSAIRFTAGLTDVVIRDPRFHDVSGAVYVGTIPTSVGVELRGDVAATLTVGSNGPVQRWATALTTNRAITLSTTGAYAGASFEILRPASGAFTLDVGGLVSLGIASYARVVFDGTSWRLAAYGPLGTSGEITTGAVTVGGLLTTLAGISNTGGAFSHSHVSTESVFRRDVNGGANVLALKNDEATSGTLHSAILRWIFREVTTPAEVAAAAFTIKKEQNWTSTASTQDAKAFLELALNGTLTRILTCFSSGNTRIGATDTDPGLAAGSLSVEGILATAATSTAQAGFRLPHGTAPTSPVDGDAWTTTAGLYVRINGVTVGPLT